MIHVYSIRVEKLSKFKSGLTGWKLVEQIEVNDESSTCFQDREVFNRYINPDKIPHPSLETILLVLHYLYPAPEHRIVVLSFFCPKVISSDSVNK